MAKVNTVHKINVATASFPYYIQGSSKTQRYKIYGTKALSADIAIDFQGTPAEGMEIQFDYSATITSSVVSHVFGDYELKIFGTKVPYSMLAKKCKIICEYSDSAWGVFILPSADSTYWLGLDGIDHTAVLDQTTLDADGSTEKWEIKDGGVGATQLATNAVTSDKILAAAVTLAKLYAVTRGSILVGGAAAAEELDATGDGKILVGDGTDLKSVAVSGDVTMLNTGAVSIGAAKILSAMIKSGEITNAHINASAAIALTKLATLTASMIPQISSAGVLESSGIASSKLAYVNVTTPGTAEASKAVVLNASKKIDELDITSLKIGGTAITKTAEQINAGVQTVTEVSADYYVVDADDIIIVDTSAAIRTVYLKTLSTALMKPLTFKRTSANYKMTLACQGSDVVVAGDLTESTAYDVDSTTFSAVVVPTSVAKYQVIV